MKFAGVILAAVFIASCAPVQHYGTRYQVFIDTSSCVGVRTANCDVGAVIVAIEDWQKNVPGLEYGFVVSNKTSLEEGEILLHFVPHTSINPYHAGLTIRSNEDQSEILIDYALSEQQMLVVIKHELGHAMGLQHTGPGTVMCPNVGCSSPNVTCHDVDQYLILRNRPAVVCTLRSDDVTR